MGTIFHDPKSASQCGSEQRQPARPDLVASGIETLLVVPDYESAGEVYPGGIQPGNYSQKQVVELLRRLRKNPTAICFVADMLEP